MTGAIFEKAKPIWLKGLSEEMNIQAGFRAVFKARKGDHVLRVTGASVYRIWMNGEFIGHGPARCGHGYYRVDEWALPVVEGKNLVAIEVAGYNANSFAYLDQPSFIQAEVACGSKLLASTGSSSFAAYRLKERVQKTQRYSFQRPFTEVYKLSSKSSEWYTKIELKKNPQKFEVLTKRKLVARGVPYPKFETKQPVAQTASGTVRPLKDPKLRMGREYSPKPDYKAFPVRETLYPGHEIESLSFRVRSQKSHAYQPDTTISMNPVRLVPSLRFLIWVLI